MTLAIFGAVRKHETVTSTHADVRCVGAVDKTRACGPVVPGNSDLVDTLAVEPHPFLHPTFYVNGILAAVRDCLRTRAALQIEALALRHQLDVLQRSVKRPKLTAADRFLWARLSRFWTGWRSALVIVKPETVIAWHLDLEGAPRPAGTTAVVRKNPVRPPVRTRNVA
jgi:hypothetical protein